MTRSTHLTSLLLVLVLVAPLLVSACGKSVGETIDDATITTRVKTAMLNDPAVGGLRIDVDTFKGAVTLSGSVKSQAEKDQAIALARRVSGVTEVKDNLQIAPAAPPTSQQPPVTRPAPAGQ
jgi:hyperosmotically inducible protein